jgi:hypothetical protein
MTKKKEELVIQPLLLSKQQVAKMLSHSVSIVDELVAQGLLPEVRLFPNKPKSTTLFHSKDVYSLARRLRNQQNPNWDII